MYTMSFTTNSSNLSGKSTTNAFDIIANSLIVNKDTLVKGDLTVLGNTNIGNVTLENANVDNLTVNNLTATNPIPITSGGTGLATIGLPNEVLTVNPAGTALIYTSGLINPVTVLGTGFTGTPTFNFGIEADTGSLGRGFIRTGPTATSGLVLGSTTATVLRLWSNFSTDSNAEITNSNANFTYNSTGSSGVFQVLNNGGGISFTNSGVGTISMATAGGAITLADPTSISGAVSISTAGGIFNLSTGAGATNITTLAGNMNLTTGAGAISLTTGLGNINLTTVGAGIISLTTETAGAINIGATVGAVNLYGSAVTLGAPVIYIGTGSAVPIPSILTFACGAVTGITGAWTITTLAFQLNALSISLNSTNTIALNNNTTVSGTLDVTSSIKANSSNISNTTALNPSITVFNSGTIQYGMDLGYGNSKYRTRIFCPPIGDIALSSRITGATSQSQYTDYLVVNGSTGNISLQSRTTITSSYSSGSDSLFTVINTNTNPLFTSTILAPNMALNTTIFCGFGKSLSPGNSAFLSFVNASTPSSTWSLFNSTTEIIQAYNGAITLNAPTTNINGILNVVNANIFTNQNIISGIQVINSGNATLTFTSPKTILIKGGSGSIITLPDATTLIPGYTYTINNNSTHTATVNQHTSGTVGTIFAGNCAEVVCYNTSSANGQWDIHISAAQGGTTDWANPGTIGSSTPNTGQFTTLAAISSNSSFTSSLFTATNNTITSGITGAFLAPNLDLNQSTSIGIGKSLSNNNFTFLLFGNNTVPTAVWSIYNSSSFISQQLNGPIDMSGSKITLQAYNGDINIIGSPNTYINSQYRFTSAGNAAFFTNPGGAQGSLNACGYILSYSHYITTLTSGNLIDFFSSNGTNSVGSISTNGSNLTVNSTSNITLTAPEIISTGPLRVTGAINVTSQGTGVCMGLDAGGFANIQLNGSSATGGYLDFSTNGTDFYTRILGQPGIMTYYANQHIFQTVSGENPTTLSPSLMVPSRTLTLDASRNIVTRVGGSNRVYNANSVTAVPNNSWQNINDMSIIARAKGGGALTWVSQTDGFINSTGQSILISATFSCQRATPNTLGVTAIRILGGGGEVLGVQDVSGMDAVSISGQTYMDAGESIQFQIYQNSGSLIAYHNVYISINTFPLPE